MYYRNLKYGEMIEAHHEAYQMGEWEPIETSCRNAIGKIYTPKHVNMRVTCTAEESEEIIMKMPTSLPRQMELEAKFRIC